MRDIKSAAVAAVEAIGLRNEDQVAAFRDFEPPEFSRAYRTLRRGREGYRGRIGDPGGAQWAHSSSTVLGRLLTELETRLSESTGTDRPATERRWSGNRGSIAGGSTRSASSAMTAVSAS